MNVSPKNIIHPDKIKFQKQPDNITCLAAVAAMIINKPIEQVIVELCTKDYSPPYALDVIASYLVRNNIYIERAGSMMLDLLLSNMIYIGMSKLHTDNDLLHSSLFSVDTNFIATVFDPSKDREYTHEGKLSYHSLYAVHDCN